MSQGVIEEETIVIDDKTLRLRVVPDKNAPNPREKYPTIGILYLPNSDRLSDKRPTSSSPDNAQDFWKMVATLAGGADIEYAMREIEDDIESQYHEALTEEGKPPPDLTERLEEEKNERVREAAETIAKSSYIVLPVYKYGKENITYSTTPSQSTSDDEQVGWIYAPQSFVRDKLDFEKSGKKSRTGCFSFIGTSGPTEKEVQEKAREVLEAEMEMFTTWVAGEVVGYEVEDAERGETVVSRYGFYDSEQAKQDAKQRTKAILDAESS